VRILVITKRQYMAQDLLDDRFGRFFEIPIELGRLGHEVRGLALSYRTRSEGQWIMGGERGGGVCWTSLNLGVWILPGIIRYLRYLGRLIDDYRPELLWACSDAFHAITALWAAGHRSVPFVVDLYDNFESFPATRILGIRSLFLRACRKAAGLTCISLPLIDKIDAEYATSAPILALENAIRSDLFRPLNKQACRQALDLPQDVPIVGTAGALQWDRGIDDLFDAFRILEKQVPDLYLAVAGPRSGDRSLVRSCRMIDLGRMPLEKVPMLFNALDVAIICNRDSEFGRYCFPQKFYEMVACGIPVVAANVGALARMLGGYPLSTYRPGEPSTLADSILKQLANPTIPPIEIVTWREQAEQLSDFFSRIGSTKSSNC
jgi:teichuronic acid biosynthesis glycosyltransferase TuaC